MPECTILVEDHTIQLENNPLAYVTILMDPWLSFRPAHGNAAGAVVAEPHEDAPGHPKKHYDWLARNSYWAHLAIHRCKGCWRRVSNKGAGSSGPPFCWDYSKAEDPGGPAQSCEGVSPELLETKTLVARSSHDCSGFRSGLIRRTRARRWPIHLHQFL